MFYYLYEIKNNINSKIYIGVHKTNTLNDGYMGSGKVCNQAIKKYGIENFTKTILEWFDSESAMYARETQVVNANFLLREDVYNIKLGGIGGHTFMNTDPATIAKRLASIRKNPAVGSKNSVYGKKWITDDTNSTMIAPTDLIPYGWKLGRTISAAQKISVASYRTGTIRITNGVQNKYANQTTPIPEGWREGWKKN